MVRKIIVTAFLSAALFTQSSHAQSPPSGAIVPGPSIQISRPAAGSLSLAQRKEIARDLVAKWQAAASARPGGGGARWARLVTRVVESADASNVLNATTARSLDEVHAALMGASAAVPAGASESQTRIGNGGVSPQSLGDYYRDYVYTPLPNGRCRIANSQALNSPLTGERALYIEDMANYASQGGTGTYSAGTGSANCGIPTFVGAYALSIRLFSPTANGTFKVYALGQTPAAGNTILMNAGSFGSSADLIVKNCIGCSAEIVIQSDSPVHYLVDVIGYFMPPTTTRLECQEVYSASTSIPAQGTAVVTAPSCPAGFSEVSTFCDVRQWNVHIPVFGQGMCQIWNAHNAAAPARAFRRCCRVPGR